MKIQQSYAEGNALGLLNKLTEEKKKIKPKKVLPIYTSSVAKGVFQKSPTITTITPPVIKNNKSQVDILKQKESIQNEKPSVPPFTPKIEIPLVEQGYAENKSIIQSFLDETKGNKEFESKRNAVIKMIQNSENENEIEDTIVRDMGYKSVKQKEGNGFLKGIGEIGQIMKDDAINIGRSVIDYPGNVAENIYQGSLGLGADIHRWTSGTNSEGMPTGFVGNIRKSIDEDMGKVQDSISNTTLTGKGQSNNPIDTGVQTLAANTKMAGDIINSLFGSAIGTFITPEYKKDLEEASKVLINTGAGDWLKGRLEEYKTNMKDLEKLNPKQARKEKAKMDTVLGLLNIVGLAEIQGRLKTSEPYNPFTQTDELAKKTYSNVTDAKYNPETGAYEIPTNKSEPIFNKEEPTFSQGQEGVQPQEEPNIVEKIANNIVEKYSKKKIEKTSDSVGRIIQGDTGDINKAIPIFRNIDVSKVETYDDLGKALGEQMDNVIKQQDELLGEYKDPLPVDTATKKIKTSQGEIDYNPIKNAIEDIDNHIVNTGEDVYNKKISDKTVGEIIDDINNNKATPKDYNDLARYYNGEFRTKIYDKNGVPKNSDTAARYEQTRKGIKLFVKENILDDNMGKLDFEYSNLANTKRLIDEAIEKVNKLKQKYKNSGPGYEAGVKFFDKLSRFTGGTTTFIRNFFRDSNIGNKVANWGDLEQNLKKELKNLDILLGKKQKGLTGKFQETDEFLGKITGTKDKSFSFKVSKEEKPKIVPKALPTGEGKTSSSKVVNVKTRNMPEKQKGIIIKTTKSSPSEGIQANKKPVLQLPGEGQSGYKKPPIITPQTSEKGVIIQSKEDLKNTKIGNTESKTIVDLRKKLKEGTETKSKVVNNSKVETELNTDMTRAIENSKGSTVKEFFKGKEDLVDYIDGLIENANGKTAKEISDKIQRVIANKGISIRTLDAEHISKYVDDFMSGKTNRKLTDLVVDKKTKPIIKQKIQETPPETPPDIPPSPATTSIKIPKTEQPTKPAILKKESKPTTPKVEGGKLLNKKTIETNLSKLTKDNIDETISKITTNPAHITKIKEVITRYIKEYGENIKNYLGLLADDIADIVGARTKLIGGEKAKLFDKSRWEKAKEMTNDGKKTIKIDGGKAMSEKYYKGEGNSGGKGEYSTLGSGLYSTPNIEKASQYGKVREVLKDEIPNNPLRIDGYSGVFKIIMKASDEGLTIDKYIQKLGYDGAQVFENGKMEEQVKYFIKNKPKITPKNTKLNENTSSSPQMNEKTNDNITNGIVQKKSSKIMSGEQKNNKTTISDEKSKIIPKQLEMKTYENVVKKFGEKEVNEALEKFKIKCIGGECGANSLNSYFNSGKLGEIKEVFLAAGAKTPEEAIQLSKSKTLTDNLRGRPSHFVHFINGKPQNDLAFTLNSGFYVLNNGDTIKF